VGAAPDAGLAGYLRRLGVADGPDFYVRQLPESNGAAALRALDSLSDYCGMCDGFPAHAKSGRRCRVLREERCT
jgi:hypothetical protein